MKKIILFSLILSSNIMAQHKRINYEPITWYELQAHGFDNLKTVAKLNLAQHCPNTLEKLQKTYSKTTTQFQNLLGTNYTWSVFTNNNGLKCLVKHDNIDLITINEKQTINPNFYELLNATQAQILINASLGIIDKDKEDEREAKIAESIRINQEIKERPYKKIWWIRKLINIYERPYP